MKTKFRAQVQIVAGALGFIGSIGLIKSHAQLLVMLAERGVHPVDIILSSTVSLVLAVEVLFTISAWLIIPAAQEVMR